MVVEEGVLFLVENLLITRGHRREIQKLLNRRWQLESENKQVSSILEMAQ